MAHKPHIPSVLNYTDFRRFLMDYYAAMKAQTPYFSYRYFSKLAGFSSPNFLKLVMEGKRNLSGEGIEKFACAMKLKPAEARQFRMLVLMNQATVPEERDYYTRQILKSRVFRRLKPLTPELYEYYSEWFHVPLRELVARSDFRADPHWIGRQFTPPLSESQVANGLSLLEKLGLIARNEAGQITVTDTLISTGDEVEGQAIKNFHREMIKKGAEAIDRFAKPERDISSLTVGVSHGNAARMKQMIQEFRKELLAVTGEEQVVEEIVQVNFQLFPLVRPAGVDGQENT
jgi:uncharacterized protein (TIGR02147 family)